MNKFRSGVESKKWEKLENTANTSFKRMLEGTAKDVDFRAVSRMLEDQSKLAKAVFDEGVAAIEKMTDEFMDRLNKERLDKGQKPLSRGEHTKTYKQVYANVMKQEAPDLIGMVQDILEHRIQEGFDDVTEKTREAINKGFDRLGSFTTKEKDVPTTDDLIALQEAAAEDAENRDDHKWPQRLAEFKATVENAVESKFIEIINRIRGQAGTNSATPAISYSPTQRAQESRITNWEVMDRDSTATTNHAQSIPLVQLSPKAEAAVVEAQSDQSKFHSVVEGALADAAEAAEKANQPDSDEEEKKADSWFRRMGAWIKDKIPKPKAGGKLSSLLSGLGKAFLLSLTAPELLRTIAEKAREYLTMDNIEKFIKATWDGIYETGADVVNWILQKLGLDMDSKKKKGLDPVRNTISERVDGKLAQYEKQYMGAQEKLRAAGGDVSKLSERDQNYLKTLPPYIEQLKKMQAENRAKGDMGLQGPKAAAGTLAGGGNGSSTVNQPATDSGGYTYDPATGKFNKIDDTALRPVEGATGGYMLDPKTNEILTPEQASARQAQTVINNSIMSRGRPATTVAPTTNVTKGEPVTVPANPTPPAPVAQQGGNKSVMQASTALTLGNFPMHSGVDDTLHLMNIGALS